jgi:antitoxin CptB
MSEISLEVRRKRLRFRAWHRGTREADFLFGSFADRHVPTFTPEQVERLEALLEVDDADLFDWTFERVPVPAAYDHDVMALLKAFRLSEPAA